MGSSMSGPKPSQPELGLGRAPKTRCWTIKCFVLALALAAEPFSGGRHDPPDRVGTLNIVSATKFGENNVSLKSESCPDVSGPSSH